MSIFNKQSFKNVKVIQVYKETLYNSGYHKK